MNAGAQMDLMAVRNAFKSFSAPACSAFAQPVNDTENLEQDIELLRKIAAADRGAFAEFYDRHSTLMFSVACKILNDQTEAQDVLQETFVQIWEKAKNFDPKLGKASSWVAVLVRNKAIDRLRASQRRSRLAEQAEAHSEIATDLSETVNETMHGQETAKLIRSAITGLPAEQRNAIELAFFSGLTQNEISAKLNQPLGTIKARIRRGLLKLRDQLGGLHD
jgi:RNA polymerase sigma-70 factor (ECF subfamily)